MNTELISKWRNAQENVRLWQKLERDLRAQVMADCWPASVNAPVAGTFKLPVTANETLAYEQTFSYNLKDTPTTTVQTVLATFDPGLRPMLVRFKPELAVSIFKKLSTEEQRRFTPVLTVKPDAPKLEIK